MSESRIKRCYEKLSSKKRRQEEEEEEEKRRRRKLSGDDSEDDYEIENDEKVRGCSCGRGGVAKKRMGKISLGFRDYYHHRLAVAQRRRTTTTRIIESTNDGKLDQQVVEEIEECIVFVEEKQSLFLKSIDFY